MAMEHLYISCFPTQHTELHLVVTVPGRVVGGVDHICIVSTLAGCVSEGGSLNHFSLTWKVGNSPHTSEKRG